MKIQTAFLFIFFAVITWQANAQTVNNVELQQMADADQNARNRANINWKELNKEDSLRLVRVFELIKAGQVNTAKDYLNSGIIFQHGRDTVASAMAVKSFKKAIELDSTLNRWWYAAAVDRDLMRRNQPQIYGTQFIQNADKKWRRYQIDSTKVTDDERKYYRVETLAGQIVKERLMNQKSVGAFYAESQSIDKTIAEIEMQHKNGSLSAYNVSEEAINNFGYQLMNKNQDHEALKVFELNTRLYPASFNTYDSYGEILMKIGRKKESIKAYKKSLKLNPKNDNVIKILKTGIRN